MSVPYVAPKSLDEFMRRVDALVTRYVGLSIHDLPDRCYSDYFEDGLRPAQVAKRIIKSVNRGEDF